MVTFLILPSEKKKKNSSVLANPALLWITSVFCITPLSNTRALPSLLLITTKGDRDKRRKMKSSREAFPNLVWKRSYARCADTGSSRCGEGTAVKNHLVQSRQVVPYQASQHIMVGTIYTTLLPGYSNNFLYHEAYEYIFIRFLAHHWPHWPVVIGNWTN